MEKPTKKSPRTVDCTPTWSAAAPMLITVLEMSTSPNARQYAREELCRMAKLADLWVAHANATVPSQTSTN